MIESFTCTPDVLATIDAAGPPTFRRYVAEVAREPDTPTGDFIGDARHEIAAGAFPDVRTRQELMAHLRRRVACAGAEMAARHAWRNHAAWRRRRERA